MLYLINVPCEHSRHEVSDCPIYEEWFTAQWGD